MSGKPCQSAGDARRWATCWAGRIGAVRCQLATRLVKTPLSPSRRHAQARHLLSSYGRPYLLFTQSRFLGRTAKVLVRIHSASKSRFLGRTALFPP